MKTPRAIVIEPDTPTAERPARPRAPVIVSEPEAILPDEPTVAEPDTSAVRPRFGWGKMLASALAGLGAIALTAWVEDLVTTQLQRTPWLGWTALALAGLALVAVLVIIGRALRDVLRGRRIDQMKRDAAEALTGRETDRARLIAREVVTIMAARPETARGRQRVEAALPGLMTAQEVLAVTERELIVPADQLAAQLIARQARQVSLVTAVSPRAIVDVAFVAYACLKVIREVAQIYGARPGPLGLFKLARSSFVHLLATGGMAAGDALIQQIIGQGLAARLSAKLGEGALNGLMTARFGLAAMALCRPLPPITATLPTLRDVAGGLLSSKDG
jgi:putative membrane protein